MSEKRYSVYGIENPLMDMISYVDDAFINNTGMEKGTMRLIGLEEMEQLAAGLGECVYTPGGSGANTVRGISWLSKHIPIDPTMYGGSVGRDHVGEKYIRMMEADYGITTAIAVKDKKTGVSLVLVTPDGERTMATYLGACEDFTLDDVDMEAAAASRIFHTTGYMWGNETQRDAMKRAIVSARSNETIVSFDLADPFVVRNNREDFLAWCPANVDILFGNYEEMSMLAGFRGSDMELAKKAGTLAKRAVIKVGARGCLINEAGRIIIVPGIKAKVVDTVGAGDSFAAGFLFGLSMKLDAENSARIANTLAAGIVTVEGCNYFKLEQARVLGRAY